MHARIAIGRVDVYSDYYIGVGTETVKKVTTI